MTDLAQLAFDLDSPDAEWSAPPLAVKRNVSGGAPRLLRRLLAIGLDPAALETAAALVAHLDREPTS